MIARLSGLTLLALLCSGAAAGAEERYALIVSGASGGPKYAESHDRWRKKLVDTLRGKLAFAEANLVELAGREGPAVRRATRENVRQAIADFKRRIASNDLLLIVLIGHGTFDGADAKFNLVGPDLAADEWRDLLRGVPGRLVLVNTTGASFPFLERLSGPGRVILTATDSVAQAFDTIFPEFFVQAFDDAAGDLDKNGRISIWEAFTYASMRVRQWYEQRGQLSTERPVLDDNADGVGKEAGAPGPDGALAARVHLDAEVTGAPTDPAIAVLIQRRITLEREVEELKLRKPLMPAGDYEKELERLLVELARVSKEIRDKTI
jgi:hypothetical protein